MNPYADFTDEALTAEIAAFNAARREALLSNVGVVQGEGRRIEFTSANLKAREAELRRMYAEARRRGMAIGGNVSAIAVEIG